MARPLGRAFSASSTRFRLFQAPQVECEDKGKGATFRFLCRDRHGEVTKTDMSASTQEKTGPTDYYAEPSEFRYDATSPESIETWGRRLEGETFDMVCREGVAQGYDSDLYRQAKNGDKGKGSLGNLVELYHFGYEPNSSPQPDFPKAGVELKTTPFRRRHDGSATAKERLVVTIVDYFAILGETFETSHFWLKAHLILLVCYEFQKNVARLQYVIRHVRLFTPPSDDLPTIRRDWERIREIIDQGRAHELHCSDTVYLEACPKGANSKSLRKQPHNFVLAMQRAFAFKASYMTFVLNRDIMTDGERYERILPHGEPSSVEEYALRRIDAARGRFADDLLKEYDIGTTAKNRFSMLVFRLLGIRNNRAEEFVKAGIEVKTIRLRPDGMPKEDISFPVFKFKELMSEEWDRAEIADTFRETRFFFVAFMEGRDGRLRLRGGRFWSMPFDDLEVKYRRVWEETRNVIASGHPYWIDSKGRRHSSFPRKSESPVGHVRPHGRNAEDVDELPNGETYTKQCFWLNRDYLRKQLGALTARGQL